MKNAVDTSNIEKRLYSKKSISKSRKKGKKVKNEDLPPHLLQLREQKEIKLIEDTFIKDISKYLSKFKSTEIDKEKS